jgi:hypothetical protein
MSLDIDALELTLHVTDGDFCHQGGTQKLLPKKFNHLNPTSRFFGFEVPLSDNRWKR